MEEKKLNRIRKRRSYLYNLGVAKELKDMDVPIYAIFRILIKIHHVKRYTYSRNAFYAAESIKTLEQDITNKIIQL